MKANELDRKFDEGEDISEFLAKGDNPIVPCQVKNKIL
jgi:hypothetical protein